MLSVKMPIVRALVLHLLVGVAGADEGLRRDAAPVEADAADLFLLDADDLLLQLAEPDRTSVAARTTADHHHIAGSLRHGAGHYDAGAEDANVAAEAREKHCAGHAPAPRGRAPQRVTDSAQWRLGDAAPAALFEGRSRCSRRFQVGSA